MNFPTLRAYLATKAAPSAPCYRLIFSTKMAGLTTSHPSATSELTPLNSLSALPKKSSRPPPARPLQGREYPWKSHSVSALTLRLFVNPLVSTEENDVVREQKGRKSKGGESDWAVDWRE